MKNSSSSNNESQKKSRDDKNHQGSGSRSAVNNVTDPESLRRKKSLYRPERSKTQKRKALVASDTTRHAQNFHRDIPSRQPGATTVNSNAAATESWRNSRDQLFGGGGAGSFDNVSISSGSNYSPSPAPYIAAAPPPMEQVSEDDDGKCCGCSLWTTFVYAVTCCFLPCCLSGCGKKSKPVQHAWREKMALMAIIILFWIGLAFLTFGMQFLLCSTQPARFNLGTPPTYEAWAIRGQWYKFSDSFLQSNHPTTIKYIDDFRRAGYRDVSNLFLKSFTRPNCEGYAMPVINKCKIVGGYDGPCHNVTLSELQKAFMRLDVSYEWDFVTSKKKNLMVYNGVVLDMTRYIDGGEKIFGNTVHEAIMNGLRTDATRLFIRDVQTEKAMRCMLDEYRSGYINNISPGCFTSSIIEYFLLFVVMSMLLARVSMAIIYNWFVAPKLSRSPDPSKAYVPPGVQVFSSSKRGTYSGSLRSQKNGSMLKPAKRSFQAGSKLGDKVNIDDLMATYVIMLVTCYSEDEAGIRTTLESLADTEYPDRQKLIFMVADGQVTGGGNTRSTPDICIDMLTELTEFTNPEAKSYVAIADGAKQLNMAKVYCGYFEHNGHAVPTILVVKCGTPDERREKKSGNRGKRDSQIILMNFLSKVMFDDRMTELEYELFRKIHKVTGVMPDRFEIVLMVDADTKVAPNSLPKMVNAMKNNISIMGLCGETQIANKTQSLTTAIQVYEYFISHHLFKNFESLFGGVTCLPGCFSAYRIKAPKGDGLWVPILASPDIIEEYSQNVVTTLHKKNLLLLGEDRFLSTLMLKTFPKRQMVFLPQAVCNTVVPDKFRVLLSQRRRWINSTIHNLMELALVKDLCGTFCISMQFVVVLELIGTILLPAALLFATFLIVAIVTTDWVRNIVPLIMLGITIFVPPLLIMLAAGRPAYVFWLFVYLLALPIWNFVLPLYSFWHFDDFTWGKTRKVEGEIESKDGHDNSGEFDSSKLLIKTWAQWEKDRISRSRSNSNARSSQQAYQQQLIEEQQQKQMIKQEEDTRQSFANELRQALAKDQTHTYPEDVEQYQTDEMASNSKYSNDDQKYSATSPEFQYQTRAREDEHFEMTARSSSARSSMSLRDNHHNHDSKKSRRGLASSVIMRDN